MGIFILAIVTIGLMGASQSKDAEIKEPILRKEIAIERCVKQGHEKKCELRYK